MLSRDPVNQMKSICEERIPGLAIDIRERKPRRLSYLKN
jgi:hypothetical protein